MDRPENATWAKDNKSPMLSDSFDLPLQGTREGEYEHAPDGDGEEDPADPTSGTYKFNKGWV